ncbi:hypothetical protein LIER_36536 [Lithospermum erythrorhizon]|uniref:Uncharacterized protein n=1 Tax=Lithospermum erythrorhizon TaxID=34254 RepID=A0AAV3P784_LITER
MPGAGPEIAMHRLHVNSIFAPIKQRKRTFNDEKNMSIRTEIEALLKARAIRELQFPKWIANVVLVKKPNNKCETPFSLVSCADAVLPAKV